jgi:hypothetical protein
MVVDVLRTGRIAEVEFEGDDDEEEDRDEDDNSSGELLFEEEIDVAGTDMDFLENKPRKMVPCSPVTKPEGEKEHGDDAQDSEGVDKGEKSRERVDKKKSKKSGDKATKDDDELESEGDDREHKDKKKKVNGKSDHEHVSEGEGQEHNGKKKSKKHVDTVEDTEHESEGEGQGLKTGKEGRFVADPQDNAFWQDPEANVPLSQADSEDLREFDRRMMSANKVRMYVCMFVCILGQ